MLWRFELIRQAFIKYMSEIKAFFGEEWFQAECDKAGEIPDVLKKRSIHPMIYYWIQTERYINNKTSLPGLNLVPKYEMLSVFELAQYIRIVNKAKVCDLSGNILSMTIQDLFQNKLRATSHYYSTLYEIQIASLYIRKGYLVNFIHDTKKHPEFVVNIDGEDIYIECKWIGKKVIERANEENIIQLYLKIEKLLIAKNLGVIIVSDRDIFNEDNWLLNKVKGLINAGISTHVEKDGDYSFKTFSASLAVPVSDNEPDGLAYEQTKQFIEKQVHESFSGNLKIFPWFAGKLSIRPPNFRCNELQGCLAVAFRETPNLISGINNLIKRASSQLPKQGIGILYVACPPYDASDVEINEFWKTIENELNSITRIYALVITGTLEEENSFSHFSTIKTNIKCNKLLPNDFQVLPLLDKFALKFEKT